MLIGTVLLVLYYIGTVLADLCGGFSFTYVDLASYNSLFVFLRSVGVVRCGSSATSSDGC